MNDQNPHNRAEHHSEVPAPKKLLKVVYKFLIISAIVHVVGLLIFGGIIVIKKMRPEPVTFVQPPQIKRVEPKKRQYKLRVKQQQKRSSRPKVQPRMQSTRVSDVALPAVKTKVAPIKNSRASLPGMGDAMGEGFGFGGGTGGGGQIFGVHVKANNLGVILDVSFSTHNVIDKAVKEIQKSFPKAILVLAPGCAMNPNKRAKIYSGKEFEKNKKRLDLGPKVQYELTDFLLGRKGKQGLLDKNREFKRLYDRAKRQDRLYVVHVETPSGPMALGGVREAIEFLDKEGVDGIYWFADYEDAINGGAAGAVLRLLKEKKITVYQHVLGGRGIKDSDLKLSFAKKTGGEIIRVDPK